VDDPKTLEILRESQQRIKSMSFIHETIYRTADFSRLEFMDYIKTIASNLIQSYRTGTLALEFRPEMESVGLNLDQAIPCGLIINELVSNALKYAYKGRKKGVLTVVLREENDDVILAVKDDGVGLPKDFAFEKNNSLGIQLVYALLDQLDATVKVNQSNGTEFFIRFHRK
jgi:two-component sensor histidine kinase